MQSSLRLSIRVGVILMLVAGAPAQAQSDSQRDWEDPPRSFDGTPEDAQHLASECQRLGQNAGTDRIICSYACGRLARLASESADRPLTGRLPSICLNAYDAVLAVAPTPEQLAEAEEPLIPTAMELTPVPDVTGETRVGGRWSHRRAVDGKAYLGFRMNQRDVDIRAACGSQSMLIPEDSIDADDYRTASRGARARFFGVDRVRQVNSETGEVMTDFGCIAEGLEVLGPIEN